MGLMTQISNLGFNSFFWLPSGRPISADAQADGPQTFHPGRTRSRPNAFLEPEFVMVLQEVAAVLNCQAAAPKPTVSILKYDPVSTLLQRKKNALASRCAEK